MADRMDRAQLGEQVSDRNSNDMNDSVEDMRGSDSGRSGSDSQSTDFEGRGAQKEGNTQEAQGTGYTNDQSGQLQEDDSLSGSQGRHGRSGSRQGARRITRSNPDRDRKGGQTAQNPRGRETDEIDRSRM